MQLSITYDRRGADPKIPKILDSPTRGFANALPSSPLPLVLRKHVGGCSLSLCSPVDLSVFIPLRFELL